MKKLGIYLDSGSVAYSLVDTEDGGKIEASGVLRFQNGMKKSSTGEETPIAGDRTDARGHRRMLKRKRQRKIALLSILSEKGFCPTITKNELDGWRYDKVYPENEKFRDWLSTDIEENKNPYADRVACIDGKLDFSTEEGRFTFGRAMYHLCQRRGYLSNAKDEARQKTAGEVLTGIRMVNEEMARLGFRTLGEYLNSKMGTDERIRGIKTSRLDHYRAEFKMICQVQEIPVELENELYEAIFSQRPLKSQKRNVGKCVFENKKYRCQTSQPIFEEYRMLQFINNIRVKPEGYETYHILTEDQRKAILPLFFRKSKEHFDFKEIVNAICGKPDKQGNRKVKLMFNYREDTTVTGCPVIATIISLLGCEPENWKEELQKRYRKALRADGSSKEIDEIVMDVWRVLDTFDDSVKKAEWFVANIEGVDEEKAADAAKFVCPEGYQPISVSFIRKTLPWLHMGYRYDEAVFIINTGKMLPECSEEEKGAAEEAVINAMNTYDAMTPSERKETTKADMVFSAILQNSAGKHVRTDKFIHPSQVEKFPKVKPLPDGTYRLGSPMDGQLKNPMVVRTLTELRHLLNSFLASKDITADTEVHLGLSREMNSKNDREGIRMWQKMREKQNAEYSESIKKFYKETYGREVAPTEDMILKYRLWEEQHHVCLYTGKTITLEDIYGPKACFDIEHTIPVTRGGDDSDMNKTLCDTLYNQETKGASLPSEMANFGEIMARVQALGIISKVNDLESAVALDKKKGKVALDPETKAKHLRFKAKDTMELEYWKGKLFRLQTEFVPKSIAFGNETLGNTIKAYAVTYLKSVFKDVQTVNTDTLNSFRRLWGFESRYAMGMTSTMENVVDPSVLACIDTAAKAAWAKYWKQREEHTWSGSRKPYLEKPWASFTKDVLAEGENIIVRHSSIDRMLSGGKRKVRDAKGRIRKNAKGDILYQKSDRIPFQLFDETIYGVIEVDGEKRCVKRIPFSDITRDNISKIVDPTLRDAIEEAVEGRDFAEAMKEFKFNGKPVRHVRCFCRNRVENIIPVKEHRDCRPGKEYRAMTYQNNAKNYALAVYGEDISRIIRSNDISDAIRNGDPLIPLVDEESGKKLTAVYKAGTKLIVYEKGEKVALMDKKFVSDHLYIVNDFAPNGRKACIHYYLAKDKSRKLIQKQFDGFLALVEGRDFYMDRKGNVCMKPTF